MGMFDSFRRREFVGPGRGMGGFEPNPLEAYEIQEPVERMVAAQKVLDGKAHDFLERFREDEVFAGILDVDSEWRCWMEGDRKNSCLFFDDTLDVFDNDPYDHFVDHYSADWKQLAKEQASIDKMGKSLDEYKILKTSLYNVFNNKNGLSEQYYFEQIYYRAKDYNMKLERHSKGDLDLLVSFKPLDEVNRGKPYVEYKLYVAYNPEHGKDGFDFSVTSMDACSATAMYSGPVDLPLFGSYSKFEKAMDDYFLGEQHSLFYYDALKSHRQSVKAEHGIPADYFEGTFVDTKKLVNFSDKSYQYGNSDVFIPKSQVSLVGDTLFMKRWLYYKLKGPIEKINEFGFQKEQSTLASQMKDAEKQLDENNITGKDQDNSFER